MRNCLSRALACACFVVLVVVIKHAETAGAVLRHKVDWPSLRGGRVGGRLPGPPGHFDMVWASPVCTEYSRALTMRPRRLEEGDALVLRALEIMAHFDPLMWVIENPATGLLKTRPFMERLPWVDVTYCKYGTPYRKQTRLWTNMRWRPSRGLSAGAMRGKTGGI